MTLDELLYHCFRHFAHAATEGATLLVVAVPRFGDLTVLDDIERFITERMAGS